MEANDSTVTNVDVTGQQSGAGSQLPASGSGVVIEGGIEGVSGAIDAYADYAVTAETKVTEIRNKFEEAHWNGTPLDRMANAAKNLREAHSLLNEASEAIKVGGYTVRDAFQATNNEVGEKHTVVEQ